MAFPGHVWMEVRVQPPLSDQRLPPAGERPLWLLHHPPHCLIAGVASGLLVAHGSSNCHVIAKLEGGLRYFIEVLPLTVLHWSGPTADDYRGEERLALIVQFDHNLLRLRAGLLDLLDLLGPLTDLLHLLVVNEADVLALKADLQDGVTAEAVAGPVLRLLWRGGGVGGGGCTKPRDLPPISNGLPVRLGPPQPTLS